MNKKITRRLVALLLLGAIGFSPAFAYAKNDNGNKSRNEDKQEEREERREEKKEKKEERKQEKWEKKWNKFCNRFFEHRLGNCFVPFGIAKKFRGTSNNASTTPDTLAPVISDLRANPNTVRATILWNTNERSDSTVFWSTSAGFATSSATSTSNSNLVREHRVVIEGLTASTTYYAVVRSKDAAGNATSSEISFKTSTLPTDNSAPVVSSVTLMVGTSTASVGWSTNENATSRVYYGTSPGLDVNASTTAFIEQSTLKQTHSITLTGLATSTLYYMAVESKDSSANRTVTPVFSGSTTN